MKINKAELKRELEEKREFEFFLSDNTSVYIVCTEDGKIFITEIFYRLYYGSYWPNYLKGLARCDDVEEVINFLEKEIYIKFV